MVERSTLVAADLPAERTYIPIEGGEYTGSTIHFVRQFSKILGHLTQLSKMRKHRKDPQGILGVLGCECDRFEDIDKPSDYELAKDVLA